MSPADQFRPARFARIFSVLALVLGLTGCAGQRPPAPPPLEPVASLDLDRYLGTWYEIAKYPNWFQTKCAGGTSATYSRQPDGAIRVVNRCRRANGDWDEAVGEAHLVGAPGSAKLEVRFAPAWLAWLPVVWGDYWVIDLDPDYQLAAVSEPDRDYLWILARQPTVAPAAYQALVGRLQARGFDPARLQLTPP